MTDIDEIDENTWIETTCLRAYPMTVIDENTWIETTYYRADSRTLWVVRVAGEIMRVGEVTDDPSGSAAHQAAKRWADEHHCCVAFVWKHWNVVAPG